MTAREDAEAAAMAIPGITSFPDDSWGDDPEGVDYDDAVEIARTVSDVWEPLLSDLVNALIREAHLGHWTRPSTAAWEALSRAQKALLG